MQQARSDRSIDSGSTIRKKHQRNRRGNSEPGPRSQSARIACADEADRKPYLATGRPRKELTECDDIGVGRLVKPAATHDELFVEVAEVRNRTAEATQPQLEEHAQNLKR